jgi:hypothetical protein
MFELGQEKIRAPQQTSAWPLPPDLKADVALQQSCQRDVPNPDFAMDSAGAIGGRPCFIN